MCEVLTSTMVSLVKLSPVVAITMAFFITVGLADSANGKLQNRYKQQLKIIFIQ